MAETQAPLAEKRSQDSPTGKKIPERLVSLDAFRGATIALMVLVNTAGGDVSYAPLNHSEWNGWTITDMVFPSFLWIVGVAITLSLGKRLAMGVPKSQLFWPILRRAAIIYVLGLIVYMAPAFDLGTQRILGVLQRIAICYLIASCIYMTTNIKGQILWILGLFASYWMLMTLVPVPGYGAGNLTRGGQSIALRGQYRLGTSQLRGHENLGSRRHYQYAALHCNRIARHHGGTHSAVETGACRTDNVALPGRKHIDCGGTDL